MIVTLIRHGATKGNLEKRYIGSRTDEPLLKSSKEMLGRITYPSVRQVFTSPMLRCRETAAILYPDISPRIIPDFRECDFGAFENKNYEDLCDDACYQAWIDSGGNLPFPDGESRAEFAARSLAAFRSLLPDIRRIPSAIIAHGGTIMSIMECYARPPRDYFEYQVRNGEGYNLDIDSGYFIAIPG